ncbi:hypothetical protein PRZ48_013384 [Zasmidium cellare]|uniref:Ubiquitin-like domain-containing protein n=1 Tax=Zasmidium cellare TaxID=395010 RepID=A0ABR0E0V2_ZASCE|nr:hypothetical protein PRZ48_013384 [Zasmidium cellare]
MSFFWHETPDDTAVAQGCGSLPFAAVKALQPTECIPTDGDYGPNAFGALTWGHLDDINASPRRTENVTFRLLRIEVVSRIENTPPSAVIWRMEYHLIEGLRHQWCQHARVPQEAQSRVYLSLGGFRRSDQEECKTLMAKPKVLSGYDIGESMHWRECIVEAKMEETGGSGTSSTTAPRPNAAGKRITKDAVHKSHTQNRRPTENSGDSEDNDAHSDVRSDRTVQQKVIVRITSSLPASSSAILRFEPLETVQQVLRSWCKRQSPEFRYQKADLWLVCGQNTLSDSTLCKDIVPHAGTQDSSLGAAGHAAALRVVSYPQLQAMLNLRRHEVDLEFAAVRLERIKRGLDEPAGDLLPSVESTTEPVTVHELCNGVHTAVSSLSPAVKLIVTPFMPDSRPWSYYRKELQNAGELLESWKGRRSYGDSSDQDLVLVHNDEILDYTTTWWSISRPEQRWTDEDDKVNVKSIDLQIMTREMFNRWLADGKPRNPKFAGGSGARGGRKTSLLGKRRR